jgi:hypothetical protein
MKRWLAHTEQVLRGPWADAVPEPAGWRVVRLTGFVILFGGFYGAVMGSFGGVSGERFWQVVISGVKVPLLLLATFAISLPSFFVLNTLLGVRADFAEAVRALVSTQAGLTIVLAALAPYLVLWYVSFAGYRQAVLFNGVLFAVASLAAQGLLRHWYRPLIARNPRHRWLVRMWLLVYVFVGIQMAWVLRPFVGSPGMPVQFFREEAWGNAYVVVGQMIWDALTR